MSVEAKFKKPNDNVAEYDVSFDGQAPLPKGSGEHGRSQASSALSHHNKVKARKDKYLKALQIMERKAMENGSISVKNDPKDGDYFEAIIDGDLVFEGYNIDELIIRLSEDRKPSEGHQGPGF